MRESIRSWEAVIKFCIWQDERGQKGTLTFYYSMGNDLQYAVANLKALLDLQLNPEKDLHRSEQSERPRQQAPFDANQCANVTAPDGANECITAPNFTSAATCSRNEHNASVEFNDDGGKKGREGGVKGGIISRLRGHSPDDTLYQSLSPPWSEKRYILHFLYDDPNLPPSPSVPADSSGGQRESRTFRFSFCPSAVFHSPKTGEVGGGGGLGFLFTVASSILMLYPSAAGLAATTVSTLVPGCEEAACYLLFADRYTQRCGGSGEKV